MKTPKYRHLSFLALIVALVPLLMASCSTGPAFTPVARVPSGKSVVYVYRKGNFVGAAAESHIFVNGKHLTKLPNSAYAPALVSSGSVVFSTLRRINWALPGLAALSSLEQKQNERLHFHAEAGKTYYVKWSIGDKMKLVDAKAGEKEIRGLKLSKLDDNH